MTISDTRSSFTHRLNIFFGAVALSGLGAGVAYEVDAVMLRQPNAVSGPLVRLSEYDEIKEYFDASCRPDFILARNEPHPVRSALLRAAIVLNDCRLDLTR